MNIVQAAKSGHGKSYTAQKWAEDAITGDSVLQSGDSLDNIVIVDPKDEFRGLVKEGMAKAWLCGPDEANLSVQWYKKVIESQDAVVFSQVSDAKNSPSDEQWIETVSRICRAVMAADGKTWIMIDESHEICPNHGGADDHICRLATKGDGLSCLVVWTTQRPSALNTDVTGNAHATMLGLFTYTADLDRIDKMTDYNNSLHDMNKPDTTELSGIPEVLHASDAGPVRLRQFTDDDGRTVGSEWVYADESGQRRIDTSNYQMQSTHYGGDRPRFDPPTQ